MSSLYVRNLVRNWLSDSAMRLPFVDTINTEETPPGPQWSTVAFVNANTTVMTYCGTMAETGVFDFIALGKPGIGDRDLLEAAEEDVARLLAMWDPNKRLSLLRATPPVDFIQGSTPWYTVSMSIEYAYSQPVRLLPTPH
jgi:hypothetical protein